MIRLYDTYAVGVTVLAIVLLEVTAVSWCYGLRAMSNDIKAMLGFKPNYFWLVCWKFLSPAAIIVSTKLCWLSGKIGANQHNFFPLWTRTNRQDKLKLDHTSTKPDQPKPDQVRPNIMFEWIIPSSLGFFLHGQTDETERNQIKPNWPRLVNQIEPNCPTLFMFLCHDEEY